MVEKRSFGSFGPEVPLGTGREQRAAHLYILSNDALTVRLSDLGAAIVGIDAPNGAGEVADVVLGFDEAAAYYPDGQGTYFGATVGPSANRVEDATVAIEGATYRLPANEGANNLHTDAVRGLHAQLWHAEADGARDRVTFTLELASGEPGSDLELPGRRAFSVTYELDGHCLRMTYEAATDAPTFINLTNHSYFNLAGQASGQVTAQELAVFAERFLPIDGASIPTGELRPVAGTPFDFRAPKPIGRDIETADEQLERGHGYDHCFCIDGYEPDGGTGALPEPRPAARTLDPASGRGMELWTTLPGLQLYTGNFIGGVAGKGGHVYEDRGGFALEPEFYPAGPSHPAFPSAIFRPGHPYRAVTEYRFFTTEPAQGA